MSISKKLLQSSAAAAAVCNSESIAPFGNEASYNKNVAIYQFEDNANDSSGNGNNGTASGVTYVTGKFDKAASFNTTTSGINIGDIFSLGTTTDFSFSVSQWINFDNLPATSGANYLALLGRDSSFGGAYPIIELYLYNTGGGVCTSSLQKNFNGSFNYSSGYNSTAAPHTFTTDTWYHHVVTYDSSDKTTTVYVDGAKIGSYVLNSTAATYTFTEELVIGSYDGSSNSFDGLIDQVRFYSKILTHEEITTLYVDETTSTASSTEIIKGTSCVAYYPLDYDSSDKSDNFHGTATAVQFGEHGKINFAADFDGSTSYIQMADNIFQYSALSISLWFWGPPSTSGWNVLFNNSGYISGQRFLGYILACVNDRVIAYLSNTSIGSDATHTMSASYNIGAWNFIVATMDSTNQLKMYLNGASAESFTTSGYGFNNSYPMNVTIGTRKSGQDSCTSGCEWFPDRIDEVRVFNRILTSTEATTLYELTACSHTCTTDNQDFVATNDAYYKLSGDANDSHSGTYNGTANNVTWASGRYGSSAVFNGSSSYILTGGQSTTTEGNKTVSAWAYPTIDGNNFVFVWNGKICLQFYNSYWIAYKWINGKTMFSASVGGSDVKKLTTAADYPKNNWYHVAIVQTGTGDYDFKLYINGSELAGTQGATGWGGYTSENSIIGSSHVYSGTRYNFWTGKIDNVRSFNSALTASNIKDLYDSEFQCYITKNASDPFGGSSEVAFFKFDNNLTDSTGSYAASASSVSYTTTAAFGTHSLSFNDTNNYIDFGTSGKIPVVSVSYWVKMNANGTNTRDALIHSEETSSTYFGAVRWGSNDGATGFYAGGAYWNYSGTDWQLEGKWHHVYQDKDLNVYLNGLPINSGSAGGTSQNIRYIGQYPTGNSDYYMNGYLDHVRVFNTKLTGDQIWQLFVEGNG